MIYEGPSVIGESREERPAGLKIESGDDIWEEAGASDDSVPPSEGISEGYFSTCFLQDSKDGEGRTDEQRVTTA